MAATVFFIVMLFVVLNNFFRMQRARIIGMMWLLQVLHISITTTFSAIQKRLQS